MDSSILDYELPREAVAQFPADRRDASRLLVYDRASGSISHLRFSDIGEALPQPFAFVRNNAAVLKARIFAKRPSGGSVECLLLSPSENGTWRAMLRPGKKLPIGSRFGADGIFQAEVVEKFGDGQAAVRFVENKYQSVIELSEAVGAVPLPPYIERDQKTPDYDRKADNERYETVYADPSKRVAAAAPTAGLHFTPELEKRLMAKGHEFHSLTLHVGLGTFQPIKSADVLEHKMHSEIYEIPKSTAALLKTRSKKILAVGTTSLRASEDFIRKNLPAESDILNSADLFIYPPQKILSADALVTNFHLPRSTLMCLVGAFISPGNENGVDILKNIYKLAIEKNYRFFSYGDAMLIL